MKPKSELQKRIVSLSEKLPQISQKHKDYAFDKCFEKYVTISRNTLYCLECGHSWKPGHSSLVTTVAGETCPNCNKVLKFCSTYRRFMREYKYFGLLTTKQNMQVVRIFFATKLSCKNASPSYFIHEVMQHWIDESGKITSLAKQVNTLSSAYDQWQSGTPLEIRTDSANARARYSINPYIIYPSRKILPILKRNGFKGFFYRFAPQQLFSLILSFQYAETLLKSKQISLLEKAYLNPDSVINHWPSIRIAIRNNYEVKDASIWMDYIQLLTYFRKDILNPKFVCPVNLMESHDLLVHKKSVILEEQRRRQEIAKAIEDQQKYEEAKSKFFGLIFSNGEISITPLKSIQEFYEHGTFLKHCIHTNEYYNKENSLLLSAKINDTPIETIEISLSKMKIIQARGKCNLPTKYNNEIINLVNRNLSAVADCC